MIIKTMSRKAGIERTINYLFKDTRKLERQGQKPIIIRKNLRTRKMENMIKEFKANEQLRQYKRKDAVLLHHVVISFHAKDSKNLDEKKLRDITAEYMKLKGPNLYVATVHFDKGHQHIHIAESGTQYMSGKANRISKGEFTKLKVSLQTFQQRKYPELFNSLVRHEGNSKETRKTKAINERQTNKKALLNVLAAAEKNAKNLDEFLSAIRAAGHEPYYRGQALAGVKFEGDTKYRFSRLGFDEARLEKLNEQSKELEELESIRNSTNEPDRENNSRSRFEEENDEDSKDIDDTEMGEVTDDDYSPY